jgi:hypothetical protein
MMTVMPSNSSSLEEFVVENDALVFGSAALAFHDNVAKLNIVNSFSTLERFETHLNSLEVTNPDRLRPGCESFLKDFFFSFSFYLANQWS